MVLIADHPVRADAAVANWSLDIADDIAAVATDWDALSGRCSVSPYQDVGYLSAWAASAARSEGVMPRIGVVRDGDGRAVCILPFGIRRSRVGATAVYLGGSHVNINMPVIDPAFAQALGRDGVERLLRLYCSRVGADTLALDYQPDDWNGTPHPLRGIAGVPSPDPVSRIDMPMPFEEYYASILSKHSRKLLDGKERRILDAGGVFRTVTEPSEIDRVLREFQRQKAARLGAMGADDPFSQPGIGEFLRAAAARGVDRGSGLHLLWLEAGGAVVACRGVMVRGSHLSFLFQSFDSEHPLSKLSASDVMLKHILSSQRSRGIVSFDFGVGLASYKEKWANASSEMFDTILPVTALGRAVASIHAGRRRIVRAIKQNRALYDALKKARARLAKAARITRRVVP